MAFAATPSYDKFATNFFYTATNTVIKVRTNAFMLAQTATTNSAGDLTLQGTSTFFQLSALGNISGFQYYDLYNGGSQLLLRRKADNGSTVLATVIQLTNDVWTFGVPVVHVNGFTANVTNAGANGVTNVLQFYSGTLTNVLSY